MAPTILIAGATGKTGRSVVETLSELLENTSHLSGHRILALTRSLSNPTAQKFAKLPGVEVAEKNWAEVDADWLRENEVVRAFIAPHTEPGQFPEESAFHLAALRAGVKYVVRISTTAANVRPDSATYYARTHWAIEALLSTPEFRDLHWTSLQPNIFAPLFLDSSVKLIKQYRETGKQDTLRILGAADVPVAIIHPDDVGALAARLLAQKDTSPHNGARLVLGGPEDVTGEQLVRMVEEYIGTKVENVSYKDMSLLDAWLAASPGSTHLQSSIRYALQSTWSGLCKASATSREVLEIAPPKRTPAQVLKALVEQV
ncbi:NAD(P)-binding protein [Poronia punctata]|nr:NAD(P)-binding protein [Poronia punctata]